MIASDGTCLVLVSLDDAISLILHDDIDAVDRAHLTQEDVRSFILAGKALSSLQS